MDTTIWKSSSIAISVLCITSITILAKNLFRKRSESKSKVQLKPEKWVKVGIVKRLIIYPIKSCAGTFIEKGEITMLGLENHLSNIRDRGFMLVDETGKQATMSKFPRMALVKVDLSSDNSLTVTAPDMPPLNLTYLQPDGKNERTCQVRLDTHVKALDCGDEIAQWFCEFLNVSNFRVYYHHLNMTQRRLEPYMYKCPQFEQSDMGAFHNETSYMLLSEESIQELNKHLNKESSWKNWRPNILIDQVAEPFAEVNWSFVRIGNGILKASVPCFRCPLTTVDNDTGIISKDGEPLNTLRKMHFGQDKVINKQLHELLKMKGVMGLRLGLYLPSGEGSVISVGDSVYAALL